MNRSETAGEENEMCIFSQVKEYIRGFHLFDYLSYSNINASRDTDEVSLLGVIFQPYRQNFLTEM